MDTPYFESGSETRHTVQMLWRHKWLIILLTASVTGGALYLSYRQTPLYRAEARVLVQALPSGAGTFVPVNLQTQSQLVRSEAIAALVKDDLGVDSSPDALLGGLDVNAIPSTEVLVIGYTSTDPKLARDAANSFAASYIEFRSQETIDALFATREAIQKRIDRVKDDFEKLARDIEEARTAGNDTLASTLEAQRSVLSAKIALLQQGLEELRPELISGISAGQFIQDASLPSIPFSPDHRRDGILGFMLGVMVAVSLSFLRERLDDRLRGRVDLQRTLAAPVLAMVPKFSIPKNSRSRAVVVADPRGAASEAYRTLRTSVQFISAEREMKSLLVTSSLAGEGKTVTAANLALAMAQAGRRVILVSADLRRPAIEPYVGVAPGSGLSEWLMSRTQELWNIVRDPGIPNLRVISSGQVPPNPAELLGSPRLGKLVAQLEDNCDMLVFDSPPVLAVTDSIIIASHVDATLLVVNASSTPRSAVLHARDELRRAGARIIGAALNFFDASSGYKPYSGSYYGEGTGNGLPGGRHSPSTPPILRSKTRE